MGGITKYWKDDVYITVFVNNCGNKTRTFYVGCNIISPSGYVTESKDFYYSGQKYLTVNIPAGGTSSVTFKEKLGWGLSSESQIIGKHNITTCVYSDSGLSKHQKCRQGYDYIQIVARPTPDVGYYKFFSEPVTSVVYYKGAKIGITNAQDIYEFPVGSHTVEFTAIGYITAVTSISVVKGVTKTYTARLSPK